MGDHKITSKREKFLYLPEAKAYDNPVSETPEPPERPGKHPCPCCGYITFPVPKEEALAYICPVCFWENDVFDPGEDAPSDENGGMTLCQGRENYHKYGAVQQRLVPYARPPRVEEMPK